MIEYTIRTATPEDAAAVHDIYGAYMQDDHVNFTEVNPDVAAYRQKILHTLERYPFLIAETPQGKVLGYVCGSPLRPHDAYRWNVESTIMLAPDAPRRQGIATALYQRFFECLRRQGYQFVYGVLVDTNTASVALHQSLGFETVGHFPQAGYFHGKWRGVLFTRKALGKLPDPPREPVPPEW